MPASLENKIAKAEAALAAGLATPNQRNDYALGMVDHCIGVKIASAIFADADDPAAAIRSAHNAELKHWRRYPIQYDPIAQGTANPTPDRREYRLYDDDTLEDRAAALIRAHFDHYTRHTIREARPFERPSFTNPDTGQRFPVFRHDEKAVVEAYYLAPAKCAVCEHSDRVPVAPFLLLDPGEDELFAGNWQAAADRHAA